MITCEDLKFGETLVNNNKIGFIKNTVIILNDINSSIAEVGVYKGGTAKIIWEASNQHNDLYLFDTFSGIPNKSPYDNLVDIGDFADVPYDDIINYFKNYNNVHIYKGIFPQDTSKYIENEKFKLVHLDVDTYTSYKESLEFFYDRIILGGYIILDDYGQLTCMGATKAIDEFFENKKEKITENNQNYYMIKA